METKHTRSPWFWARDKINQRTNLMRSGTGDYVLSPQADLGDYALSVDCWTDISDADAALIEAAPDLLEAAVRFMPANICTDNPNISDDQVLPCDVTMGELRQFRAAIAKATGEASA